MKKNQLKYCIRKSENLVFSFFFQARLFFLESDSLRVESKFDGIFHQKLNMQ